MEPAVEIFLLQHDVGKRNIVCPCALDTWTVKKIEAFKTFWDPVQNGFPALSDAELEFFWLWEHDGAPVKEDHGVLEVAQVEESFGLDVDPLVVVTVGHQYHLCGLNGDLPISQQQVTLGPC